MNMTSIDKVIVNGKEIPKDAYELLGDYSFSINFDNIKLKKKNNKITAYYTMNGKAKDDE